MKKSLQNTKLNLNHFKDFDGMDLICDFYKIRGGDELAFKEISEERSKAYTHLTAYILQKPLKPMPSKLDRQLYLFFKILKKFSNGEPSDHVLIDLKSGALTDISKKEEQDWTLK